MERRLFFWELAGALFTAALGALLHPRGDAGRQTDTVLSVQHHRSRRYHIVPQANILQVILRGNSPADPR